MYIKKDDTISSITEDLEQVFENKFTINIGQKEIVKMRNNGAITDRDLTLAKFLFKFRFATFNQIYRYLELIAILEAKLGTNSKIEGEAVETIEISSEVGIKNRLEKLVKYRILNKFYLADIVEAESVKEKQDALPIYCLDLGGRYLLANYSSEDTTDWYTTVNMKASILVRKSLIATQFYLRILETGSSNMEYFNIEPEMRASNKNIIPLFDVCFNINNIKSYFIGEVVNSYDMPVNFRDRVFKLESLLETNAWKKYYYDSNSSPVLLLIADTDETALEIGRLITGVTEMNKFRITTEERMKRSLHDLGAFIKYVQERDEIQEIRAMTFAP